LKVQYISVIRSLFVSTIFTRELIWHKSIFHKDLKDGIIAFCFFEKEPVCFPFNVEC